MVLAADALLAGAALAAFALVAAVHLDDNFHVDHVAGAWLALIAYATEGTLYPPLHEGGVFAGTRYMPLGIVLDAGAARIAGDALVAGKLVAAVTVCGVLAITVVLARRLGAGLPLALGMVGAIIASYTAQFAGTTIYGDALALALQLGALAVICSGTGRRAALVAGVLVALAFTAKFSALWGAATVLLWLMVHDRRRLPAFAAAALGTVGVVLGLAELASEGRFLDNVLGLSGAGSLSLGALLDAPEKTWSLLRGNARAAAILLPFAAATVAVAAARRSLTIADVALVLAAAMTVALMADVGAGFNHLLDLTVLVPLVVAVGSARVGAAKLGIVLAAALGLATALSLLHGRAEAREAAVQLVDGETPPHLRVPAFSGPLPEPIFTEDPTVAVQRGQRPVALDSYMLLRVLRDRPALKRALVARFERRDFGSVVLIADLDLRDPWWTDSHLGIDVARAIDRNYVLVRNIRGPAFRYRMLLPRDRAVRRSRAKP